MKRLLLALALLGLPVAALAQTSAVPTLFSYHGKVTDATGTLIGAGTPVNRAVTFRIWASPTSVATTAANRLYTEVQTVTIANGEFSVLLGTGAVVGTELKPALDTVFNGAERYLGITVDDPTVAPDPEISPRQQMVSTAFAFRAKVAEGLSGSITGSQIADGSINAAKFATATGAFGYAAFPDGLRAAIGLNVNSGGVGGTTSTVAANASDTILVNMWDKDPFANPAPIPAAVSKFSVKKNGDVAVAGNLAVAGSITGSINGSQIGDATISAAKLNFAVGGGTPNDNTVTSAKIVDSTIVAADIANNTLTAGKFSTTIADLIFEGYPTYNQGFRSNLGFNVNYGGFLGHTATIKSGVHPANNGNEDTNILVLRSMDDVIRATFTKTGNLTLSGAVSAGSATISGAVSAGSATISGGVTINGLATLSAGANISGGATVNNGATINNGARIDGGLNVGGPASTYGTNFSPYQMSVKAASGEAGILSLRANDNTERMSFLANGDAYKTSSNWSIYSDRRLKHDIQPLSGALDRLLRLRSVTFQFNDPEKFMPGVVIGFIAQEVQEVFPEWVKPGPSGMLSLNLSGFESSTVQALRELRDEKDQQLQQRDATIAALEKNVAAMKSESAETKAQLAALQQAVAALSARASN